jgi:beta-glucanase (GH16 family)
VAGDEFNYTGPPRADKWSVYDGAGHAGNGLRRPDAWHVDGSVATVTGDSAGRTGGMSARFGSQKYGRWEARMRTSVRDPAYHAVLLLWPDSGNWPADGEIDYAEGTADATRMRFFLHYGADNSQTRAEKVIDSTQWHHYAVEWSPKHVVGYIDGVEWFRDENTAHLPPGPMHQTVQLDWFPDGTSTKETTMSVDWVRVYELE